MNIELFISRKITSAGKGFSKPIVNIAILGIALGLAIMILTLAIVTGFQKEIREKVIGFGSHIQITNYDNNESYEGTPINRDQPFVRELNKNPSIRHIQSFATKAGIIKTKGNSTQGGGNELQGVVVKGVGSDFDWEFFKKNIIEGDPFSVSDTGKSDKLLISKFHKEKLNLKINDKAVIYFIQNQQQRAGVFTICGIYETGLGDLFDQIYVIADIGHVQKLNGWDKNSIGGFEVLLNDYESLDEATEYVNEEIGFNLKAESIKEVNRSIFSWLDSFDSTCMIVIVITALVAIINMISALLVLILEKTVMIGTLKSLGQTNWSVRKIFIYNASFLIGRGLLFGNIIGIFLCPIFLQVPLDKNLYYVSHVAINLDIIHVLLLNAGTFLCCLASLLLPSYIITYITPVKAMRFA